MAFKVMSVTEAAAERITEIMENSDKPVTGVRVGVKNAGCAGMAYTLDYVAEPVRMQGTVGRKGDQLFFYSDPQKIIRIP